MIHDGQKNPYLADFQKQIVHEVESSTKQQKKLYFPSFIYVQFDAVCELKPITSRQETRMVKTLKKSKARITELTKENEQLIKQGNIRSNDIRILTKEKDELIRERKDTAKKNKKLSKENDDLAKKFKAVDELLSQMIQGVKKSPKSNRKSRSESEDISPESFVLPIDEETLHEETELNRCRSKRRRDRKKKRRLHMNEIELKESDFDNALEESQVTRAPPILQPIKKVKTQ